MVGRALLEGSWDRHQRSPIEKRLPFGEAKDGNILGAL